MDWTIFLLLMMPLIFIIGYFVGYNQAMDYCTKRLDELR